MLDVVSRLGLLVSRAFRRTAPDPFVIAIGLALLTAILALLFGEFAIEEDQSRIVALIDAWRDDTAGFWRFLAFGMQMCLILVTGHALAATKPVRAMINALASLPRGTAGAAALISLVAGIAGLINWGLGLIVGALLAREVGAVLHRRGIRAHYPLLAAAGYTTMMLWHGGLSGSAPLTMTNVGGAERVIDRALIERVIESQGGIAEALEPDTPLVTLDQTLASPLNLIITGGLLLGVPLLLMLFAPRRAEDMQTIDHFPDAIAQPTADRRQPTAKTETVPDRLDRSIIVASILAIALAIGFIRYLLISGPGAIGLNQINMAMFALGLILHGSPKAYMEAAAEAAKGCAGIIIQFPIYGGIMGMMVAAGLVTALANFFVEIGNETTMPLLSFIAAAIVNLFVPSGGGQWAIQGPIALEAGLAAGVEPAKMIMAVAYGDQLTNMLQPFWALPLLAITGVKARDIVGYTALIMIAGALWMGLGLLIL